MINKSLPRKRYASGRSGVFYFVYIVFFFCKEDWAKPIGTANSTQNIDRMVSPASPCPEPAIPNTLFLRIACLQKLPTAMTHIRKLMKIPTDMSTIAIFHAVGNINESVANPSTANEPQCWWPLTFLHR